MGQDPPVLSLSFPLPFMLGSICLTPPPPPGQVFAVGESGGMKIGRFGAGWVEEEPHWLGGSNGMKEAPRAREGILQSFAPQGAGHMVPTDKPQAALTMFSRFLNKQPY